MLYSFKNKLLNAKILVIHPNISDLKPLASNLKRQKILLLSLNPFLNLTHKLNQALKSLIKKKKKLFLSINDPEEVIHAFITSRLECCNSSSVGLSKT